MNTQTQEALKMAIEALEHAELVFYITKDDGSKVSIYAETVNACKEALEQPAQEPVWQGLTDDEVGDLITPYEYSVHPDLDGLTRAIEQALKEKNHG
jgi:hypothetical protein